MSSSAPISPYTTIVVTLCLSGILGLRHVRNIRRIEFFNDEMSAAIARAREDLANTLKREHTLNLANSRLQDRLQIAHDLHDGLGGSLVHMMVSVEQMDKPVDTQRVLSMLKLIRDDLRQTIDSSSSLDVDVPRTPREWIAPLRYRFTQLCDEIGIHLDWQYPEKWNLVMPSAIQCLALHRLIEEGLTNVIKHSRARNVSIVLELNNPNDLILSITDDGVGFNVDYVKKSGLSIGMRSMHARINKSGGNLDISSKPGKTIITAQFKLS